MTQVARRTDSAWPALPFEDWQDTCETLHRWTQIVGKTCLALAPMANHLWQVTLHVTPRGLGTAPLPHGDRALAAEFDVLDQHLYLRSSDGAVRTIPLVPQSVADFYSACMDVLAELDLPVRIRPVPVEVPTAIPFAEDRTHASYDPDAANRWWRLVVQADVCCGALGDASRASRARCTSSGGASISRLPGSRAGAPRPIRVVPPIAPTT
jgi:hypothetical protein